MKQTDQFHSFNTSKRTSQFEHFRTKNVSFKVLNDIEYRNCFGGICNDNDAGNNENLLTEAFTFSFCQAFVFPCAICSRSRFLYFFINVFLLHCSTCSRNTIVFFSHLFWSSFIPEHYFISK